MEGRLTLPNGTLYLEGITIIPPLPVAPVVPVVPLEDPPVMTTVVPVVPVVPEEVPEVPLLVTVTLLTFVYVCVMVEPFTKPGTLMGGAWVSVAVDALSKGNVNEPDVMEVLGIPGET